MSVQELKSKMESLPLEERRQLAAFLVSLRHRDMAEYRAAMARKIDDASAENWLSLAESDRRLES